MPRRKRSEALNAFHISEIERKSSSLEIALRQAQTKVRPFSPHYEATSAACDDLRKLVNLINDRPADYVEPRRGPGAGIAEAMERQRLRSNGDER